VMDRAFESEWPVCTCTWLGQRGMGSTLSAEAGAGQSAGNSRDIGRLDPHLQRFVHEGVDYSLRLL